MPEASRYCAQCGAPSASASRPAASRTGTNRTAMLVFLVASLLVGSVVGGTIVLGLLAPRGPSPATMPTASFSTAAVLPYEVHIPISSMSTGYPPSDFLLRMSDGMDASPYIGMPGSLAMGDHATMTMGSASYAVFWMDRGTVGVLDAGDSFLVSPMHGTGCPSGGTYLSLHWMNRSLLATSNFGWNCSTRVSMTLGAPVSMGMMTNGSMAIPIESVSESVLPMNFMMRLGVGSNTSYPVWMAMGNGTAVMMPGYSSSFGMGWDDRDGSGTLSPGDRLTTTMSSMMTSGMSMSMTILWRDGSTVASAMWTS